MPSRRSWIAGGLSSIRGPIPRAWAGRLRRDLGAEAIAASTSMEGVPVTLEEVHRILAGDRPVRDARRGHHPRPRIPRCHELRPAARGRRSFQVGPRVADRAAQPSARRELDAGAGRPAPAPRTSSTGAAESSCSSLRRRKRCLASSTPHVRPCRRGKRMTWMSVVRGPRGFGRVGADPRVEIGVVGRVGLSVTASAGRVAWAEMERSMRPSSPRTRSPRGAASGTSSTRTSRSGSCTASRRPSWSSAAPRPRDSGT